MKPIMHNLFDITAHVNVLHEKHNGDLKAYAADPQTNLLARVLKRYFAAQDAARNFGYVGVGCITFAEKRMQQFQIRGKIRFA